jgi:membrane fusion protein (multidrug efflux system)
LKPEGEEPRPTPPPNGHDLGFELPPPATLSPARAVLIGAIVIGALGVAFFAAWLPRHNAQAALARETTETEHAGLRMNVVKPKVISSDRALVLPGTVAPLASITIHSRANGFVKKWYVDISDRVKENDLLAELDTPDLDQQLAQARAQLAQAQANVQQAVANAEFSKANLERYQLLTKQGLAAQQDFDQKSAQAKVDDATVAVAKANVDAQRSSLGQLEQQKSFARVVAPFAGTITSRSVDVGALVTNGTGTPLFTLVAVDPARVFVPVPQDVAPSLRVGASAEVTVREYPGRKFKGTITRSAGALDPTTRTMNTEVRVSNGDNALIAGMYAEVSLSLPNPHKVYEVPATAVFNDANGVRLALVGEGNRVKMTKVVLERDTGQTVLVSSGVDESARVVSIARAEITDGSVIEPIE